MSNSFYPAAPPETSDPSRTPLADRLAGVLFGTALGDALGLPAEGMSARAIARRFGRVERFHLLVSAGFVSDDTEQAALVAQSLARHPADPDACAGDFRRALLGWFCRVPWGVGRATVRACLRIALRLHPTGVHSAGNGAAMRSAIIGAFFCDHPQERRRFGVSLAEATHRDPRAVEAALYVAELSAACIRVEPAASRFELAAAARKVVREPSLRAAIERAESLAREGVDTTAAAAELKSSGFVLHTVPFALFCFLRHGGAPLPALTEAISAGGDTDSIAAILGAWLGALHGAEALPKELLSSIHDGPFGPAHLRALANCLARIRVGEHPTVPGYSWPAAFGRNLLLLPVILAHGFRRLLPF